MKDNVLVIGGGGREQAFAEKLRESEHVEKVYMLIPKDFEEVHKFVENNNIGLTVVGPEQPLVNGIVDYFNDNGLVKKGHLIFGPTQATARLEGDKAFAKAFMIEHNIPTAAFETFTDQKAAEAYIRAQGAPIVLKAAGLAAGKGVIVCLTLDQAINALNKIMYEREFGDAGNVVVVEEFMTGEEASILAITDGKEIRTLISAQDHKPICDGDKGPNTGGMGAYTPAPIVTPALLDKVYSKILTPKIEGMKNNGTPFKGCLYAGLMVKDGEPRVVEFNVRFGDPETQPVLMMLDDDLYTLLKASANETLSEHQIKNKSGASCCIVMATNGYPGKYEKGFPIGGLEKARAMEGIKVYEAGTKKEDGQTLINGGRVLNVTAYSPNGIKEAQKRAYRATHEIDQATRLLNNGKVVLVYRNDIANKAIKRLE